MSRPYPQIGQLSRVHAGGFDGLSVDEIPPPEAAADP
jgi:hypothetical protein